MPHSINTFLVGLEDLLNPLEESQMEDATNEEICQVVLATCNS